MSSASSSYVPNALLGRLVGQRLYSVQFVMDYVQLHFDGSKDDEPLLNCDVLPRVERGGRSLRPGQLGYADALRSLIPQHVTATSELDSAGLRLDLEDGSIVVHPEREELVGPEIALLRGFKDGSWMCWRPGEDSFKDLA